MAAGAPVEVAQKSPQQQPLNFLLEVMANESHPIATTFDAAKAALPYLHFRKGVVDTSGRDVPLTVTIISSSSATWQARLRRWTGFLSRSGRRSSTILHRRRIKRGYCWLRPLAGSSVARTDQ